MLCTVAYVKTYERKTVLTAKGQKGERCTRVCVTLYKRHVDILRAAAADLQISHSMAVQTLIELQGNRGLLAQALLARLQGSLRNGHNKQTDKNNADNTTSMA